MQKSYIGRIVGAMNRAESRQAQNKALPSTSPQGMIVANARTQSKIYKILRSEQQKKLSDLERTQGALTSEGK